MARRHTPASTLSRPVLLSSIGLLCRHLPLATVNAVLNEHDKHGERDRLLPPPFVVYFIVALSLYMANPIREVLRIVLEGLKTVRRLWNLPIATKGALSRARTRLGWAVMATLFQRLAQPRATPRTPGPTYRGWRLVALDGTSLSVPATPANTAAFGKRGNILGEAASPLLTLVALVEVGTHAVLAAAFGTCTTAERVLAASVLPAVTADMLVLEDRGYAGHDWWHQVRATGAAVLCRLRSTQAFPPQRRLPDGSYLSVLRPAAGATGAAVPVRVIEYTLTGIPGVAGTVYRLVTSLLDPTAAPARELAALYHESWEAESTFDDFKTPLRGGPWIVLRSKTPDLVRQEVYGLLLAHYVVRAVLHDAAVQVGEDPDQFYFLHAVRVLRRKLPQAVAFSPSAPLTPLSSAPA